eukprot:scaffold2404_cov398-Prasinococcus_capsulatus_cf.AAC.28
MKSWSTSQGNGHIPDPVRGFRRIVSTPSQKLSRTGRALSTLFPTQSHACATRAVWGDEPRSSGSKLGARVLLARELSQSPQRKRQRPDSDPGLLASRPGPAVLMLDPGAALARAAAGGCARAPPRGRERVRRRQPCSDGVSALPVEVGPGARRWRLSFGGLLEVSEAGQASLRED